MTSAAEFGTWTDGTSDLIYRGSMPYLLDGLPADGPVVDLGGANGLSRLFLPGRQITTVDIDPATGPDVIADALTYRHHSRAETVLIRYLLHYLTDGQVRELFRNLARWHHGGVVVVQFTNETPASKAANSADTANRRWRHPAELLHLLGSLDDWRRGARVNRLDYTVEPDFYASRLGSPGRYPHAETLLGLALERRGTS
jgi:hypothetical protein